MHDSIGTREGESDKQASSSAEGELPPIAVMMHAAAFGSVQCCSTACVGIYRICGVDTRDTCRNARTQWYCNVRPCQGGQPVSSVTGGSHQHKLTEHKLTNSSNRCLHTQQLHRQQQVAYICLICSCFDSWSTARACELV
jgi:hypothetical protein